MTVYTGSPACVNKLVKLIAHTVQLTQASREVRIPLKVTARMLLLSDPQGHLSPYYC